MTRILLIRNKTGFEAISKILSVHFNKFVVYYLPPNIEFE